MDNLRTAFMRLPPNFIISVEICVTSYFFKLRLNVLKELKRPVEYLIAIEYIIIIIIY